MFFSVVILKNIVKTHHVLRSGSTRILRTGKNSKLYFKIWISTYVMVYTSAANVKAITIRTLMPM